MTDRDTFLTLLRQHRHHGLHSLEARRQGVTGNPSQRARELVALGVPVRKQRARLGDTWGVRFWLEQYAPMGAAPVAPDRRMAGGKSCEWCSGPMEGKRPHARFCSDRCRAAAWESEGASKALTTETYAFEGHSSVAGGGGASSGIDHSSTRSTAPSGDRLFDVPHQPTGAFTGKPVPRTT